MADVRARYAERNSGCPAMEVRYSDSESRTWVGITRLGIARGVMVGKVLVAAAGERVLFAVVVLVWALARRVRVERRRLLAKSMVVVGWRILSVSGRLWGAIGFFCKNKW